MTLVRPPSPQSPLLLSPGSFPSENCARLFRERGASRRRRLRISAADGAAHCGARWGARPSAWCRYAKRVNERGEKWRKRGRKSNFLISDREAPVSTTDGMAEVVTIELLRPIVLAGLWQRGRRAVTGGDARRAPQEPAKVGQKMSFVLNFEKLPEKIMVKSLSFSSLFSYSSIAFSPAPKICHPRLLKYDGESFQGIPLALLVIFLKTPSATLTLTLSILKTQHQPLKTQSQTLN